jgi:hypothetical protein
VGSSGIAVAPGLVGSGWMGPCLGFAQRRELGPSLALGESELSGSAGCSLCCFCTLASQLNTLLAIVISIAYDNSEIR